jgi:hypothetical protein
MDGLTPLIQINYSINPRVHTKVEIDGCRVRIKPTCQPSYRTQGGARRFTHRCYPEIHTPNSTPKQHRKSQKKFSVTAYVDNSCSGSLPALDRN